MLRTRLCGPIFFKVKAWGFIRCPQVLPPLQHEAYKRRAWLLPRVRGLHWTAILVDFRSKLVIFVDSLGSEMPAAVLRVCAIIEAVSQVLSPHAHNTRVYRALLSQHVTHLPCRCCGSSLLTLQEMAMWLSRPQIAEAA